MGAKVAERAAVFSERNVAEKGAQEIIRTSFRHSVVLRRPYVRVFFCFCFRLHCWCSFVVTSGLLQANSRRLIA